MMEDTLKEMGLSWKDIYASLEKRERDRAWFSERINKLRQEYPQQFVAIDDGEVVAHSSDPDELTGELKQRGFSIGAVLIEFVSPEDWIVVL